MLHNYGDEDDYPDTYNQRSGSPYRSPNRSQNEYGSPSRSRNEYGSQNDYRSPRQQGQGRRYREEAAYAEGEELYRNNQKVNRADREQAAQLNRRPIRESPNRSYQNQQAQQGYYPPPGQNAGYPPATSGGFGHTGVAPNKSEFFLSIIIQDAELSFSTKATGFLGGLLNQIPGQSNKTSTNYQDEKLAKELLPEIQAWANAAIQGCGWSCRVMPMMLPPLPGYSEWHPFLSLQKQGLPIMVVMRAESTARLPKQTAGLMGTCDWLCDLFTAPPSMDNRKEMQKVAYTLQDNIIRGEHHIRATVEGVTSDELYHILVQKGWSRELVTEAINRARRDGSVGPMNYHGSHGQHQGGYGHGGGMDAHGHGGMNAQQPMGMGRYQQW